ncbi:MAG: hypothetical protein WCD69_20725 [Xanthobacteraceae bacterium]
MKSFNTKLVLFSLGIVAMLTGPAFAQKRHHVTGANQSAVYRDNQSGVYNEIPGYDSNGGVVGIPNRDQRW